MMRNEPVFSRTQLQACPASRQQRGADEGRGWHQSLGSGKGLVCGARDCPGMADEAGDAFACLYDELEMPSFGLVLNSYKTV